MALPVRVVKVGGSLLDLVDLPGLWRNWRQDQVPAVDVLVPGGGPFADVIRRADGTHGLADAVSHELAIQCLGATARLLAALLPETRLVGRLPDALTHGAAAPQSPLVLDVWACWQDAESGRALRALPASWEVTSDSLAAVVAHELGAEELVLLKSSDAPAGSLTELAASGYVDSFFPQAAAGLNVRLINLRSVAGTGSSGRGTACVP